MAISHAGHNHPSTPAARSACRKLMDRSGQSAIVESDGSSYISQHIRRPSGNAMIKAKMDRRYDEIKMTGLVARRMARQAAAADRIQPRRSGARVSAGSSTCVQAALHVGRGRCACGWHTDNHCYADCQSHAA